MLYKRVWKIFICTAILYWYVFDLTKLFPNLPCVFNVDKLREDETLFKVVPLQKFLAKFYAYFSWIVRKQDCCEKSLFTFVFIKKKNVTDCIDIVIHFKYYISTIKFTYTGICHISLFNIRFGFILEKTVIYYFKNQNW